MLLVGLVSSGRLWVQFVTLKCFVFHFVQDSKDFLLWFLCDLAGTQAAKRKRLSTSSELMGFFWRFRSLSFPLSKKAAFLSSNLKNRDRLGGGTRWGKKIFGYVAARVANKELWGRKTKSRNLNFQKVPGCLHWGIINEGYLGVFNHSFFFEVILFVSKFFWTLEGIFDVRQPKSWLEMV